MDVTEWPLSTTDTLSWIMILAAMSTFFVLQSGIVIAPYGRYSTSGWGFMIDSKVAWFTQELWSFAIPVVWIIGFASSDQLQRLSAPANALLAATFIVHYFYRDLVFPFRLRKGKPTPFTVWALAAIFCVYNGFMQTNYLLNEARSENTMDSVLKPRFLVGMVLWFVGWIINLHSDHTLISLRKPRDRPGVYKIPRGGMFEYVSAANYFGEIVEWTGWAIASWSLPATAFAVFTFCNLAPRAWQHHQWYKKQFPRYPKKRKAIIPFLW